MRNHLNKIYYTTDKPTCVLTIAGSDPSGGAGIQSDLRTFAALGVVGLSAITALTVQNSQGVLAVHPVPADVLFDQIEAILEDTPVRSVKIGMLGGEAQVRAVAQALRRYRPHYVVLDPVLASTGGVPLLDEAGRRALLEDLLPLCHLITPNIDEAILLTGMPIDRTAPTIEDLKALAGRLLQQGGGVVLLKGGHLAGEPTDLLVDSIGSVHIYPGERIETPHTHGTGCLLSAALAAYLAVDNSLLPEMVGKAKLLVTRALHSPICVGKGRGYPDIQAAARAFGDPYYRTHQERQNLLQGLYVLTDPDLRPDRNAEEIVQAALAGGARIVQLRDKRRPTQELIRLAKRLRWLAWKAGALFIVNDRVDAALAANADGVHLGPDDMYPDDARRLLGPDKLIGISVSTIGEAIPWAKYASYLGVGAIFGSATKGDAGPPVGLDRIREIKQAFPDHPLVAIGGINAENIGAVAAAGADAAAVVSAVVAAPDMEQATRDLVQRFRP